MSDQAVADHLWQSTLCALVIGLLVAACRRNRAAVRYGLWFTASIKFLVPFAPLIELGHKWNLLAMAPQIAAPVAAWPIAQLAAPFSNARPTESIQVVSASAPSNWLGPVLVGTWVCGFLAIAWIRLRGWRAIASVMRTSVALRLPDLTMPPGVTLRAAQGLPLEPRILGLWRPWLLIPAGLERHLSSSELSAVVAHELCHVQRRDNFTAAIHMIVEAVFWFHPLVWWIGARLVHERERACDEHVIGLGADPAAYAESIVKTCRVCVESPVLCVAGATGSDLKKRIDAILVNRPASPVTLSRKLLFAAAALVFVLGPIVGGMHNASILSAQSLSRVGPQPPASAPAAAPSVAATEPSTIVPGAAPSIPATEPSTSAADTIPSVAALPTVAAVQTARTEPVPLQGIGWLSIDGARGRFYGGVDQFCCPEYVTQTVDRIRPNWKPAGEPRGPAMVVFTVTRDGRITDASIERSSGDVTFDHSAVNAVEQTQQVSELPADFPRPTLTIHLFVGPNPSFRSDLPGASKPPPDSRPIQVSYAGRWTLVPGSVTGHIPGLPAAPEMEIALSQDLLTITRDRIETQTYRRDGTATDLTGYRKGTLTMDGDVLTLTTTRVRPGNETVTIVRDALAFSGNDLVVTRTLRVERPAGVDLGVPQNRWEARYIR